ncbi:MAG TPA: hypothetical protein VK176_10920 [Phycisphaerales bacterium]|nr:hypothetical protein [Phycisphaerales bacterium]
MTRMNLTGKFRRSGLVRAGCLAASVVAWSAASASGGFWAPFSELDSLAEVATRAHAVDAAAWAPSGAFASARLFDPDQRTGSLRAFLNSSKFYESPAYALVTGNPGLMQAQIGLLGLAAAAGTDAWTAVGNLLGRDTVLTLYPGNGAGAQPKVLIVSVARDGAARAKFVETAATAAGLMRGGKPVPEVTTDVEGRSVMTVGALKFCTDGEAMLFASDVDLIRLALATKAGKHDSIVITGELDAAEQRAPADAMAIASFSTRMLVQGAAAEGKPTDGLVDNPLGGFLLGGWVKSIVGSDSMIGWLEDVKDGLSFTTLVEGREPLPASHAGFRALFPSLALDWSKVTLPEGLMTVSVARDWASLFGEREGILTVQGATQAAAFAGTMTTLMGNFDFLEDFLPRVNGPVRFFMQRQDFSGSGYMPTPALPAFAMVAPLKGASEEMLRQRLMSGSQMAVSFINFDAAQKQQPGLLMGLADHRGVSIFRAHYPSPGAKASGAGGDSAMKNDGAMAGMEAGRGESGEVNVRYNFEPVVAVVKDHYIVATSLRTMTALVDAVLDGAQTAGPAGTLADQVTMDGAAGARMLGDNREELIVKRMLDEDEDRATAERNVDGFLALISMIETMRMESQPTEKGYRGTIAIKMQAWKPGDEKALDKTPAAEGAGS